MARRMKLWGSIELIKDTLFQLGVLIGGLKRGFHNDYPGSAATRTAQCVHDRASGNSIDLPRNAARLAYDVMVALN